MIGLAWIQWRTKHFRQVRFQGGYICNRAWTGTRMPYIRRVKGSIVSQLIIISNIPSRLPYIAVASQIKLKATFCQMFFSFMYALSPATPSPTKLNWLNCSWWWLTTFFHKGCVSCKWRPRCCKTSRTRGQYISFVVKERVCCCATDKNNLVADLLGLLSAAHGDTSFSFLFQP